MTLTPQKKIDLYQTIEKIKPPPRLKVSQCVGQYRRLSAESSAEPGKWHTERTPYQRELMKAVNDPSIETALVMSSAHNVDDPNDQDALDWVKIVDL